MSTRSTVCVAVNCVSAGITSPAEAKTEILEHISRDVLGLVAPELTVEKLEQLAVRLGCAFEVHAGQIENIHFF